MGSSISTWEGATAYFTFADSPVMLVLFAMGVSAIVIGLITSIIKHENKAFKDFD